MCRYTWSKIKRRKIYTGTHDTLKDERRRRREASESQSEITFHSARELKK